MKTVDPTCATCSFSAVCLGAGGSIQPLIVRLTDEYKKTFMEKGPPAQAEYEHNLLEALSARLAADRVKEVLEKRLPAGCPMLRRHNEDGVELE